MLLIQLYYLIVVPLKLIIQMRLSRRLSGLYKPILLIASAFAFAYLLLADPDNSESGAHAKKSKHHKKHHETGDDYEI